MWKTLKFIVLFYLLNTLFNSCQNTTNKKHEDVKGIYQGNKAIAFIYNENGKSGLLDTNKNVILPAQFDYIEDWQKDGLILVDLGGNWVRGGCLIYYQFKRMGIINAKGKIVVQPEFDEIVISDDVALVKKNDLYGYIDNKGNWIIKTCFKKAYPFYKGTAIVQQGEYFVLRNKKWQKIINTSFDKIDYFQNGVAVVEKNRQWGFINYKGEMILNLDNYSGIGDFIYGYGIFKKDNKWFVIDTLGNIPIQEGFEKVEMQNTSKKVFAVGRQNGKDVKIEMVK